MDDEGEVERCPGRCRSCQDPILQSQAKDVEGDPDGQQGGGGGEGGDARRDGVGVEGEDEADDEVRRLLEKVKKFRRIRMEEVPDTWREIKITDRALGDEIQLPPPFLGEQVRQISDAAKEVLQLPPKTAVFSKILMEDIEVELSKAVDAKARWTDMEMNERQESGLSRQEWEEQERQETQVYNKLEGTLDLAKMRVTDLPTNKEVFLPDERPDDVESKLQGFSAIVKCIFQYYSQPITLGHLE